MNYFRTSKKPSQSMRVEMYWEERERIECERELKRHKNRQRVITREDQQRQWRAHA